jgi:hypothetical protein
MWLAHGARSCVRGGGRARCGHPPTHPPIHLHARFSFFVQACVNHSPPPRTISLSHPSPTPISLLLPHLDRSGGIKTSTDAKFYGLSAGFPKFSNDAKDLYVQVSNTISHHPRHCLCIIQSTPHVLHPLSKPTHSRHALFPPSIIAPPRPSLRLALTITRAPCSHHHYTLPFNCTNRARPCDARTCTRACLHPSPRLSWPHTHSSPSEG